MNESQVSPTTGDCGMHDFRHGALASRIDIWQSGIEGCSTRNHENAAADPVDYMTTLARSSAPNFQGRSFDSIGDKNVANSAHDDSAHSYLPATNAYFMSVQPSGCGKRSNNRRKRLSNSAGAKSPRLIWKQLRHDFKSCPVTKRATERVLPQPARNSPRVPDRRYCYPKHCGRRRHNSMMRR
jgi:hypothetical protein